MTYQNFIERYRKLLLEIIPDFYKEEEIINFTFKRPADGKSYFAGPKPSVDIKYRVEIYSGRRITDEEFSALKEPCFKQHKKWRKKYSTFVNKMKDILPYIDHPNLPLFRFRLFKLNHKYKYLEDVLDDKTPLSIFICFVSYLVSLRKMGKDANTAETIIRNKMIDQEDEYIQKNRDRINNLEISAGVISIETILTYNKTTGKFRFGSLESIAVSATPTARARNMAENLIKCWMKGVPCLLSEFGIDPDRTTPQGILDTISDIRNILKDIKVNMPQCTDSGYSPPSEPENFNIE